jgi:hypothetical protein
MKFEPPWDAWRLGELVSWLRVAPIGRDVGAVGDALSSSMISLTFDLGDLVVATATAAVPIG